MALSERYQLTWGETIKASVILIVFLRHDVYNKRSPPGERMSSYPSSRQIVILLPEVPRPGILSQHSTLNIHSQLIVKCFNSMQKLFRIFRIRFVNQLGGTSQRICTLCLQ
jgi:hypothetical protein